MRAIGVRILHHTLGLATERMVIMLAPVAEAAEFHAYAL